VENEFYLIAAVLGVAALVGFVATRLHQPLIVAFIAVGILVGPVGFDWVAEDEPVELLAQIGIAVLLFLVGLKLDLEFVRTTGTVALVTGLGQVAFTSGVGFALAMLLGMDATNAVYVAVALTFSSTIIIVKLLSDKRELEELHGRIAIGFLIVQDIVVVLVMIVLTAVGSDRGDGLAAEAAETLARGAAYLVTFAAVTRWILPRLLHLAARSPELLLVFALAWAVSWAAASDWLGFSSEVGAFLAGFAIAATPYREAIASRLTSLRDFLLLFFFIELGAQLDFTDTAAQVVPAIALSAFVLIGNPLIVLVLMGLMGYRKRVGFLAGLTVAQISEFSLILVALGLSLGHIESDTVGLVTLVGIVTIGLSTYLILYSHPIYERIAPALSVFERRSPTKGDVREAPPAVDVILYGMGRYGGSLARDLTAAGMHVLAVDFDPAVARSTARSSRLELVYGDAEDGAFPSTLPLDRARWLVSTVPNVTINRMLTDAVRAAGFRGRIALTAHTEAAAELLADVDADLVLRPFTDAAGVAVDQLVAGSPPADREHLRDK
jgi:Kef-type K+ transport system membrane component KefB